MCCSLLKVEKLLENSSVSQFELLRFKSCRESNCLFSPPLLSQVSVPHEVLFCVLFGGIIYQRDMLKTLC